MGEKIKHLWFIHQTEFDVNRGEISLNLSYALRGEKKGGFGGKMRWEG